MFTALLAGIVSGIDGKLDPGAPQDAANSAPQGTPLPLDWRSAIERFERSDLIATQLGKEVQAVIAACKWQDFDGLLARVTDAEYETYLCTV